MRFSVTRARPTPMPLPTPLPTILDHLRVTSDEALEAQRMVSAAMLEIEDSAQIALFNQVITIVITEHRDDEWPLVPIGPARTDLPVTLTQIGESGTVAALDWAGHRFMPRPASILAAPFSLAYTAGFGPDPGDLPADLVLAVLDQALAYYDARGFREKPTPSLTPHAARIVGRYRGVRL